ncbi:MAG TPA: hypothetical protein VFE41_22585 [Acetobacteraceae bacterium]|jgi:hypothetical protein|nr:hypothetical protein [Acetobacteraceae bacterium]
MRRPRAAIVKPPDWNAEPLGLVGEIILDAGAREDHDSDREHVQHLVVALEGCGLGVLAPVGLGSG